MDGYTYTITLADGTEIGNLLKNGDCYISETEIDESVFEYNCSSVTVTGTADDEEVMETLENVKYAKSASNDGKYWFTLVPVSSEELARQQMQADLEYVAMMVDVELDA